MRSRYDEAAGWLDGPQIMDYDGQGVLDDAVHREHHVGPKRLIALQIHKGDQFRIRFKDILICEIR